jgi:hypothetical protein
MANTVSNSSPEPWSAAHETGNLAAEPPVADDKLDADYTASLPTHRS